MHFDNGLQSEKEFEARLKRAIQTVVKFVFITIWSLLSAISGLSNIAKTI